MSKGVNKCFFLGHCGQDPEIKVTQGGTVIASLSLAVSDRHKVNGEWEDRTEWVNLIAFAKTAEIFRDYVTKGSQIMVEGKIQTRSWDARDGTGERKYRTEILVNDLTLLGGGNNKPDPETKGRVEKIKSVQPQEEEEEEEEEFPWEK